MLEFWNLCWLGVNIPTGCGRHGLRSLGSGQGSIRVGDMVDENWPGYSSRLLDYYALPIS